jgi:hypothetical protein
MQRQQKRWNQAIDDTIEAIFRRVAAKGPPIDAIDAARRLGYQVLWDNNQNGRARVATIGGSLGRRPQQAIFLRRDERPERIQWAVAHEIGEQCAAEVCRRLNIDLTQAPPNRREQIANAFATQLLLPTRWFSRDARELDFDVVALKRRYNTASHELVARRLLDSPPQCIVTIFDHGKLQVRIGNQPWRTPQLTHLESAVWQQSHERGESVHQCGPPRIDVWAIHEPGWLREIMRTELATDEPLWDDSGGDATDQFTFIS